MSYTLAAYAVDPVLLETTFGSNDLSLLHGIREQCREKIEDYDAQEREIYGATSPSTESALVAIFDGTIAPELPPANYGYALEMICESIGRALSYEHFSHLNSATFPILEQLEWIRDHFRSDMPYPIPIPRIEDFPCISYLKGVEISAIIARPPTPDTISDDDARRVAADMIAEYLHWIREACASNCALVTICY
jgi:hypothetical protein